MSDEISGGKKERIFKRVRRARVSLALFSPVLFLISNYLIVLVALSHSLD